MPKDVEKEKKDSDHEADDIVFEDESSAGASALEKAKKALKACEKEKKEYLDGWKRAKADALNEKKRQQDALRRERDLALSACVLAILPVLDSVRAALGQSEDSEVQSGIRHIHTQCLRSFSDLDITVIDSVGEAFDPHRHQSVGEQEVSSEKEDNTVVEVMRVGACVDDTVIRPAMVYVGAYKEEEREKDEGGEEDK